MGAVDRGQCHVPGTTAAPTSPACSQHPARSARQPRPAPSGSACSFRAMRLAARAKSGMPAKSQRQAWCWQTTPARGSRVEAPPASMASYKTAAMTPRAVAASARQCMGIVSCHAPRHQRWHRHQHCMRRRPPRHVHKLSGSSAVARSKWQPCQVHLVPGCRTSRLALSPCLRQKLHGAFARRCAPPGSALRGAARSQHHPARAATGRRPSLGGNRGAPIQLAARAGLEATWMPCRAWRSERIQSGLHRQM